MKKIGITIFILCVLILVGELASAPKSIVSQKNGMNVWKVNHFFNMFKTEYLGPLNDTTLVVVTDKNITDKSFMVHVSDGNTVTLLKSHDVYDYAEVGDTINLITTNEPINRHRYRTKYTVFK